MAVLARATASELEQASDGVLPRVYAAARPGGRADHGARPRWRRRRAVQPGRGDRRRAAPCAPTPARSATPIASAATCARPNWPPPSTPRCRTRRRHDAIDAQVIAPLAEAQAERRRTAGPPRRRHAGAVLHHGDDAHMSHRPSRLRRPGAPTARPVPRRAGRHGPARPHPHRRRARPTRRRRSAAPTAAVLLTLVDAETPLWLDAGGAAGAGLGRCSTAARRWPHPGAASFGAGARPGRARRAARRVGRGAGDSAPR